MRKKTGEVKGQEIEEKDPVKTRDRRLRKEKGEVKGRQFETSDG